MLQIKTHEFCQLGLGQRNKILNVNLGGWQRDNEGEC